MGQAGGMDNCLGNMLLYFIDMDFLAERGCMVFAAFPRDLAGGLYIPVYCIDT